MPNKKKQSGHTSLLISSWVNWNNKLKNTTLKDNFNNIKFKATKSAMLKILANIPFVRYKI